MNDELISSIGRGLCVLVGISVNDTKEDAIYLARKLLSVRLFDDEAGKRWQKSVKDIQYELLCVSQFTLYNQWKGNKPDFRYAMPGQQANDLYNFLLQQIAQQYASDKIKDGQFGAMMQVHIQNDGPVTLEIESPKKDTSN